MVNVNSNSTVNPISSSNAGFQALNTQGQKTSPAPNTESWAEPSEMKIQQIRTANFNPHPNLPPASKAFLLKISSNQSTSSLSHIAPHQLGTADYPSFNFSALQPPYYQNNQDLDTTYHPSYGSTQLSEIQKNTQPLRLANVNYHPTSYNSSSTLPLFGRVPNAQGQRAILPLAPLRSTWSKIINSPEYGKFKINWKNLSTTHGVREAEANALKKIYNEFRSLLVQKDIPELFGPIYGIPGEFSMWMPGVALVAAYLSDKKKIKGLHVCVNLKSLSEQINKIQLNQADQRAAFIVPTYPSKQANPFTTNYSQHKVTVCIEKKDGKLSIALLDSNPVPENEVILPENLENNLGRGDFNCQELVYRSILSACRKAKCQARLLHSQVLREKFYGCEVFALQDGVAFLQDPNFFERISCDKEKTVKIDKNYEIEVITTLPPEYMIGSQSSIIFENYRNQGGKFNQLFPGKSKTLQNYLDKYCMVGKDKNGMDKMQNHYITNKSFKYLNLVILSLKYNMNTIENMMRETLIKEEAIQD